MQMLGTLADGIEGRGDAGLVASLGKLTPRLRKGDDRPERIVELMTQHPDQLLPDGHLLARQLPGQVLDQEEPMWTTTQLEHALREMVNLFRAIDLRRKKTIGIGLGG